MTGPRFPHPLTLLVLCILVAGALTWVLPAGEYQRREDPATESSIHLRYAGSPSTTGTAMISGVS